MHRTISLLPLFLFLLLLSAPVLHAQKGPVAGQRYTITYNPPPDSPLATAEQLTLIYVFDMWNVRYGTRLALWQNVLRPDTARVRFLPLRKEKGGWTGAIDVPSTAALFSYIVGDGKYIDGNNEQTYTSYVYDAEWKPVRNARFYNVSFLRLAEAELGTIVQEAEREITEYPENFPAYNQFFKLMLEQGKGSARIQQRIAQRLDQLEQRYGADPEFLNMAAETWYYVLQDQEKGLEYRDKIPPNEQWPQVFRMYSSDSKQEEQRQRQLQAEQQRNKLLNSELPAFNLHDEAGSKVAFPMTDGKARVMIFWASTSSNSGQMLATIRDVVSAFPASAVEVVAVSVDPEEKNAIEQFTREAYPFTLLFNQGATLQMLGVDSIPITYVIDGRGFVRNILVGNVPAHAGALRSALRSMLE
ncbi:MAG: redoxin domain-containing protein [Bacteroidetes bacterium]|nr:redoxin domain-containing protein [Bacteroidota bacterium]